MRITAFRPGRRGAFYARSVLKARPTLDQIPEVLAMEICDSGGSRMQHENSRNRSPRRRGVRTIGPGWVRAGYEIPARIRVDEEQFEEHLRSGPLCQPRGRKRTALPGPESGKPLVPTTPFVIGENPGATTPKAAG